MKIKRTKICNNNSIGEFSEYECDVKIFNDEIENMIKTIYECLMILNKENEIDVLKCTHVNISTTMYQEPYMFEYNIDTKTMTFIFYNNTTALRYKQSNSNIILMRYITEAFVKSYY